MTDKKVWFITGADSAGLAVQKVTELELYEQIDTLLTCPLPSLWRRIR